DEDYSEEIEGSDDKEEQEFIDGESDEEMETEELDEDDLKNELETLQRDAMKEVRQPEPETGTIRQKKKREGRPLSPLANSGRVGETAAEVSTALTLRDHDLPIAESQIPMTSLTVLGKRPHPSSDSASDMGMRHPVKRTVKSVSRARPYKEPKDIPQ